MTDPNFTLIAALLDRSGSMADSKLATESGFDEFITAHRGESGRAVVSLSMFDDQYEDVYADLPIADVPPLRLVPRNRTAMLDAIGRFVTEIGERLAALPEAERPGTVMCLIMTDGYENASREWTVNQVKALITQQRERYDWSFVFLGANIDAVEVGSSIGVPVEASLTFAAGDDDAVGAAYVNSARETVYNRRARAAGGSYAMGFTEEDRHRSHG